MKKLFGLLLYAALMFGVTAGLGMFLMKKAATHGPDSAGTEDDQTQSDTADGHAGRRQTTSHGTTSGHPDEADPGSGSAITVTGHAAEPDAHRQDEQLPVAVRSTPMSVEEIVRMGLSLKSRDEIVRKREESLRETESHQRLVLSDIASAQQEVENLLAQAHDQRAASEELLARLTKQQATLETERQNLAAEKQQIKTERDEFDSTKLQIEKDRTQLALDQQVLQADQKRLIRDRAELLNTGPAIAVTPVEPPVDEASRIKNLKETTEMFEGMSPEMAAKTIKVLSTGGATDMIVDVLTSLEQRKASAILDAISDETLVSEFLLKINSRKNPQKSATRN